MNRIEYEHAVKKAKAARAWKNQDPTDPAARLAFERDFADPVDDARGHLSEDLDDDSLPSTVQITRMLCCLIPLVSNSGPHSNVQLGIY
jgi:hypothetical protein